MLFLFVRRLPKAIINQHWGFQAGQIQRLKVWSVVMTLQWHAGCARTVTVPGREEAQNQKLQILSECPHVRKICSAFECHQRRVGALTSRWTAFANQSCASKPAQSWKFSGVYCSAINTAPSHLWSGANTPASPWACNGFSPCARGSPSISRRREGGLL